VLNLARGIMFSIFTDSGKLYDDVVVVLHCITNSFDSEVGYSLIDYSDGDILEISFATKEQILEVCTSYNYTIINKTGQPF
jgi:hypothetical protein